MVEASHFPGLLAVMDAEVARLTTERDTAERAASASLQAPERQWQAFQVAQSLQARMQVLIQMHDALVGYPDLLDTLNTLLNKRAQEAKGRQQFLDVAAKQRQVRLLLVLLVVALIAGWLLSLVGNPAPLFHILFGH